jgi:hypothetical protein
MTADGVVILVKTSTTDAKTTVLVFYPEEAGDYRADATHIGGTSQTGRDLGASVLLSSGTGTGQVSLTSGLLAWNPAWDAEVQSEVADALGVYDPPTNAEMEARTIAAANYATAANLATVAGYLDTEIAAILEDTGTTLPATLATIAGYLDTEVAALTTAVADLPTNSELTTALADLPTNAELATALGTADDAVLAQIALVKAKTDSLTFTVAGQVDSNAVSMNDTEILGTGASGDKWRGA